MYLAYLDDSGDPGVDAKSPTPTYTTACVLVRDAHWVGLFEDLIRFRRYLRHNFNLKMRREVKANELVTGSGPWATLPYGDKVRKRIFRSYMRFQAKVGTVQTFAVVIDKSRCSSADEVREAGWRHTLERVEAFARHNNDTVMLFPDSGEYDRFRKLSREMRRHSQVGAMLGGGTLSRPLVRYLIDDPVERDSKQSYMVQLADLNAYAAYRKERPHPLFPSSMWDELGPAIQGSAYMRFRRALDRENVTEALSAASELHFVGLAEALELTLLLAEKEPEKYERAAARWQVRFLQEVPNVDLRESMAVLALLAAIPANRLAAAALAEILSRRRSCERIAEALVRWSRAA